MIRALLDRVQRAVSVVLSLAVIELPRWWRAWWAFGHRRLATHFSLQRRIRGCCGCGRLTLPGEAFFACALCEDYETCTDCVAVAQAATRAALHPAVRATAAQERQRALDQQGGTNVDTSAGQALVVGGTTVLHRHNNLVRDVLVGFHVHDESFASY